MALYERRIIYHPLCLIFILWYINKFQATLNIHVAQFPEYIQDICFCVGLMYSGCRHLFDLHWASIPKVVGSIPTIARHIFQACPVWILRVTSQTSCFSYLYLAEEFQAQKL